MQIFKAVLFDIDGTLLDTSEFIFQAYEYVLDSYGYPQRGREEISSLIGKPLGICYEILTGLGSTQEFCGAHRAFQAEHLHLSKPYPKTRETLDNLKSAGIKLAAVTTRSRTTSVKTLELAGISDYLDYITALEDVENLKPHPEPLFKTLDYLQVEPENAAMVGDTDVDILAGKNAGVITIGATYGFHGRKLIESGPDYIIDDIAGVTPLVLPLFERR